MMKKLEEYINTLTDFSAESLVILQECMTELTFRKNEKLLKEGEICKAIFFISSGFCKSYYNKDGKDINTAFYFENEFATNLHSLRTGTASDYIIQACEPLKAVRLDKTRLLEAYKRSHEMETFGRLVLEAILSKQEEHLNSFKLFSPKQRFDNLVEKYPDFLQRVSLTQTASYLGISRETLSRFRAIK